MSECSKLIYCPKCTRQLEVPESFIGKKGECPYCGEKFIMKLPKTESWIKRHPMCHVAIYVLILISLIGVGEFVGHSCFSVIKDKTPIGKARKDANDVVMAMDEIRNQLRNLDKAMMSYGVDDLWKDTEFSYLTNKVEASKNKSKLRKFCKDIELMSTIIREKSKLLDESKISDQANNREAVVAYKKVAVDAAVLQELIYKFCCNISYIITLETKVADSEDEVELINNATDSDISRAYEVINKFSTKYDERYSKYKEDVFALKNLIKRNER